MDSDFYKKAQTAAMKELGELLEKRVALERRITKLRQGIASLDALILDEDEIPSEFMQELSEVGITDACRNALKVATSPRTPIEVRDWLDNSGYALSDNSLAAIHTILKRLAVNGEAETVVNTKGKVAYQWVGQKSILEQLAMGSVENEKVSPGMDLLNKAYEREKGRIIREAIGKSLTEAEQDKKVIDPFVGQGSVDIVLTNPPYSDNKRKEEKPARIDPKVAQAWLDRMDEAASKGKTKIEQDILRKVERNKINREVWEKNHPEKKK